jgi:hypothetical protein
MRFGGSYSTEVFLRGRNPVKVASRKGFEPLTPGLGNLCSILLSYRDLPTGTENANARDVPGHE